MLQTFLTHEEYKKIRPADKGISDCPFCPSRMKNQVRKVWENNDRVIMHPMKICGGVHRRKGQLMLIPRHHHKNETTLTLDERASRIEAEVRLEQYFGELEIDYVCFVRLTDQIKSIQHLHYHYIGGNIRYNEIANSLAYHDEKYGVTWEE